MSYRLSLIVLACLTVSCSRPNPAYLPSHSEHTGINDVGARRLNNHRSGRMLLIVP